MKKTVLITGASRGIGRGIALECASQGYDLVLTCRKSIDELNAVVKLCEDMGSHVLKYVGDMGNNHVVRDLMEYIGDSNKEVDILVNNAGISFVGLLTDMSDEQWETLIGTNLSSVFYCSRGVIPSMVRKKTGKILNISSIWGNVGASCEVAYSASKGGVNSFTKALAKELAPSNVQVNALALGVIDTEMNNNLSNLEKQELVEEIPAGRMGSVTEIAKIVVEMMDGKEYMTGQIITVDGGMI